MLGRWPRRFRACFMSGNPHLNGCDYLMLGCDYELRRRGFAGNSCQIVLELKSVISPPLLQERLRALTAQYPILNARPGGAFSPRWNLPRRAEEPRVRVHRDGPDCRAAILNEPLAARAGELARFDLIERNNGRMTLVFTWAHALMDAVGAEHFLATLGRPEVTLTSGKPNANVRPKLKFSGRCKLAWKNLYQLDKFCEAPPRTLRVRHR